MNLRVTAQTQTSDAISRFRQQSSAVAKYQDWISSGLRVKKPSDDPANFAILTRAKNEIAKLDVHTRTMTLATSTLNAGVSALQNANDVLVEAKQLALEGANSTSDDPQAHQTLATQVDGLIDRMMSAGNAQENGIYLFGGTATTAPPFTVGGTTATGQPATVVYAGSTDRARTTIGPGQTVDTHYDGKAVFQSAGGDAFSALIGLRDLLRSTTLTGAAKNQAISRQAGTIDASRDALGDAVSEQSTSLALMEALQTQVGDLKLAATDRAGSIEGTDYAEAIVKMNEQQSALQATMAVSAKLFQSSFLDFIR